MAMTSRGVDKFTVENIVAVFRAVPESNGTYRDVARIAKEHDGDVHPHTIAGWIQAGNADARTNKNLNAYARFTKIYQELVNEHCGPEANRSRELNQALEIFARTCECGNDKLLLEDGTVAETCRKCRDLDGTPRRGRRHPASGQAISLLDGSGQPRLHPGQQGCQLGCQSPYVVEAFGHQIGVHVVLIEVLVECAGRVEETTDVAVAGF